jgi:hypothetical protein
MVHAQCELVLHLVHDVLEDVEVFSDERSALRHLSVECNDHFEVVDDFIDWQERHQGYPDDYRWLQVPVECVREVREIASVGHGQ